MIKRHLYSTTNILTAATWIYTLGAGITAAAGTRLALQLILISISDPYSFQPVYWNTPLLYLVATSLFQNGVIFAPAALLGCSSHISSPFSGIKLLSPVTRHNHCKPRSYHQKLIGQKFTWNKNLVSNPLPRYPYSSCSNFVFDFSRMTKVFSRNSHARLSPRFPTVIRVLPTIK